LSHSKVKHTACTVKTRNEQSQNWLHALTVNSEWSTLFVKRSN